MSKKSEIVTIDAAKLLFACAIPLLHIAEGGGVAQILSQYIARLGVPFFFAASGFFLASKLESNPSSRWSIGKTYLKRVGKLLLIWELIYSPLQICTFIQSYGIELGILAWIRQIVMQTPSYLWFLTSMLVGGFLQIALWEIRAKWVIAVFLYIIGTLLNSYQFLLPQLRIVDIYYDVFLTSRNGLFFAFPLMVVGILCRKSKHGPHSLHVSLISLCCAVILFCIEVSLVMNHASNDQDTSMYFTIPLVTFCLVNTLINLNSYFNAALGEVSGCAKFWRYSSMVIYVVQFGLIMLFAKLENIFGIYSFWLTWVLVITTSLAIARLTHRTRLQQLLF